jgi:mRNA-degrading endonuclease YafQ of YafQ-DinJ toxin-antitoxin module
LNPDGAGAEPIRPLIYTVGDDWIRFERTGTHADLFD